MDRVRSALLITATILSTCCEPTWAEEMTFKPEIPEECLEEMFCERVPNYPVRLATKLFAKLQETGMHVRSKTESSFMTDTYYTFDEMHVCEVTEKKVTPKAARDSNGVWHFILNLEPKYEHSFVSVECKPNNTCEFLNIPKVVHSSCRQKTTKIRLPTINKYNITFTYFDIGCCCSCEVSSNLLGPML